MTCSTSLLDDPMLARLYWAMARMDTETGAGLAAICRNIPSLLPFAPVLDFYGSHISIRNGRMLVPGGPSAEPAWKELAGASPDSPKEFVARLLAKDDGWLAAYFDTLSRLTPAQQAYFTDAHRLPRFYDALRGKDICAWSSPSSVPARSRPAAPGDPASIRFLRPAHCSRKSRSVGADPSAEDRFQGGPPVGQACQPLERSRPTGGSDVRLLPAKFGRRAAADLPDAECDRQCPAGRTALESGRRSVCWRRKFARYGNQYLIFSEFQGLNDDSITRFLEVADAIDHISNVTLRANALGIFQANVGLWQILARQGQIPAANLNESWQKVIGPFAAGIASSAQLFDSARSLGPGICGGSAAGRPNLSQDEVISLLAGPSQSASGRSTGPAGTGQTEFAPSWTVSAWFRSTRCSRWATA